CYCLHLYYIVSFLFLVHSLPLDLHSFPTRRSSDLATAPADDCALPTPLRADSGAFRGRSVRVGRHRPTAGAGMSSCRELDQVACRGSAEPAVCPAQHAQGAQRGGGGVEPRQARRLPRPVRRTREVRVVGEQAAQLPPRALHRAPAADHAHLPSTMSAPPPLRECRLDDAGSRGARVPRAYPCEVLPVPRSRAL